MIHLYAILDFLCAGPRIEFLFEFSNDDSAAKRNGAGDGSMQSLQTLRYPTVHFAVLEIHGVVSSSIRLMHPEAIARARFRRGTVV